MLKILYVVLSCNRYIEERCISSEETWLKKINNNSDYIILTSNYNKSKIYSTNTSDDYLSNAYKWLIFLQNYNFQNYEWVFSIDDDNFVFPDRLESYIRDHQELDSKQKIAIGARHCEFKPLNDTIICGGGGILISKEGIIALQQFVQNIDTNNYNTYGVHDCFLFDIFKKLNFNIINSNTNKEDPVFCPDKYNYDDPIFKIKNNCISLHYCNSKHKHHLYHQYYDK